MSNRLLKKALNRIGSLENKELDRLIQKQIAEADMLSALLESGRYGHCVLSRDGYIKYANSSFFTLLPADRSFINKAEGKRLRDIILDDEVLLYFKNIRKEREDEDKEFYFQQGSAVRTIRITHRQIQTEEGDYLAIRAEDITEEKRKETRLRRSESLASMTTMAAGIAHEIKNPLAAMQIHLQLLSRAFDKKGTLTKESAERYISVLEEEISHLNSIAVDFLFAVRPMDVNLRLQSIVPVINSLEEFVSPELKNSHISLKVDIQPFLPRLEIDPAYLKQALLNIIKNAMNAMATGGRLTLSVTGDGDFVQITIRDTGCGIDRESLGKIFEPYFTTRASGTGLGLTVVYKIVKEHKGDISVESTVGVGTAFTIKLPVPQGERAQLTCDREE